MKTAGDGVRSAIVMPCTPFRAPYRMTLMVKNASRAICPIAPLVGIHLPSRSGMIAPAVATAMNTTPKRYRPASDRPPRNC